MIDLHNGLSPIIWINDALLLIRRLGWISMQIEAICNENLYIGSRLTLPASIMDDDRPLMQPNAVLTKHVRYPCSRAGWINCTTVAQPAVPIAKSKLARPATNRLFGLWRKGNRATAAMIRLFPPMMKKDRLVYRATRTQGMAYGRSSVASAMKCGVVRFKVKVILLYVDGSMIPVDMLLSVTNRRTCIDK